jgi:hypothetical protein
MSNRRSTLNRASELVILGSADQAEHPLRVASPAETDRHGEVSRMGEIGQTGESDELDAVADALAAALTVDWADRSASSHAASVAKMAQLAAQVMALDAGVVGAFDSLAEWAADGHRTPAVGVRHESNQSTGTARRRVQRARKLRHLDEVRAALAASEISVDAADLLLGADRPDVHDAFVDDEKLLVEHPKTLEHIDLVRVVRTWSDLERPDDADRDAAKRDEQRSAHASRTLGARCGSTPG